MRTSLQLLQLIAVCALALGCAKDELSGAGARDAGIDAEDSSFGDATAQVDTDSADVRIDAEPDLPWGVCVDDDGDGAAGLGDGCDRSAADFDCDETRDDVHPGAIEICNGIDDDCDGERDERVGNLCGGCATLQPQPGQACGACGRVVCDGAEATRCDPDGGGSVCGGCDVLSGVPGTPCGACGTFVCSGINSVDCLDPGINVCGGCGLQEIELGQTCGACEDGSWSCSGASPICLGGSSQARYYRDRDGDGYGRAEDFLLLCAPDGDFKARDAGDCDDADPSSHPYADEVCDTVDNDCDGEVDEGVENGCGGCHELTGEVGQPCGGTCGQGVWTCAAADAVFCDGADNVCGGCTVLVGSPGDSCGTCGILRCDGTESLQCDEPPTNVCGGCEVLTAVVGSSCGVCGVRACAGPDTLSCDDPGANACGGCSSLDDGLGGSCGACGVTVCDGPDAVICDDPGFNACGGCAALAPGVGSPCGVCGAYECDGADAVSCTDSGLNSCGGCVALPIEPGSSCGACGTYQCVGPNQVGCDSGDLNPCGGCGVLSPAPGDPCGTCGAYVCDTPDAVICSGDATNPCGGCDALDDPPGVACGTCGVYVCVDAQSTTCDDPGLNACGGCLPLEGVPTESCGVCGAWTCDTPDDVECVDLGLNECGECGTLPGTVGEPCLGTPRCGIWACAGTAMVCTDQPCPSELTCDDGVDDDDDGLIDCRDPECQGAASPCSPDLLFLALSTGDDLYVGRIRGDLVEDTQLVQPSVPGVHAMAIDPVEDGVWISTGGHLRRYSLADLSVQTGEVTLAARDVVTLSGLGKIYASLDSRVAVVDPSVGIVERNISIPAPSPLFGIAASPDESEVVVTGPDRTRTDLVFIDTSTNSVVESRNLDDDAFDVVHLGTHVVVWDDLGLDMYVYQRAPWLFLFENVDASLGPAPANRLSSLVVAPAINQVWVHLEEPAELRGIDLGDGSNLTQGVIGFPYYTSTILTEDGSGLLGAGAAPQTDGLWITPFSGGAGFPSTIDGTGFPTPGSTTIQLLRVWR